MNKRVRSFSGIFEWEPERGLVTDAVTKTHWVDTGRGGPPFGAVNVAGYIRLNDTTRIIFEYAHGSMAIDGKNTLPEMPCTMVASGPLSLWNTALEIHTGRIFEPILGPFYILVVPLVGLATLFILVSGFLSWYIARRKKRTN